MIGNTSNISSGHTVTGGYAGWQRGTFTEGTAEVLVVDYMQGTAWQHYDREIPRERRLLMVHDTFQAEKALRENPTIQVVIVQGFSRRMHNPRVDTYLAQYGDKALASWLAKQQIHHEASVSNWLDKFDHTLYFILKLEELEFKGKVFAVSSMFTHYHYRVLGAFKNLRVQSMHKLEFFKTAGQLLTDDLFVSIPAVDKLWEAWEQLLLWSRPAAPGAEMALTVLEGWEQALRRRDPADLLDYLASVLAHTRGHCQCADPLSRQSPEFAWYHQHHGLLNQAIWDLLHAADMTGWVRMELEKDLAGPVHFIGDDPRSFGKVVLREAGLHMRSFLRPEGPDPMWFGPTVDPA